MTTVVIGSRSSESDRSQTRPGATRGWRRLGADEPAPTRQFPPQQARLLGRSGSFSVLFVVSLFAEFIANDRPLIASYKGEILFPVFFDYPEDKFGGF